MALSCIVTAGRLGSSLDSVLSPQLFKISQNKHKHSSYSLFFQKLILIYKIYFNLDD